jgi:hypothetical protein
MISMGLQGNASNDRPSTSLRAQKDGVHELRQDMLSNILCSRKCSRLGTDMQPRCSWHMHLWQPISRVCFPTELRGYFFEGSFANPPKQLLRSCSANFLYTENPENSYFTPGSSPSSHIKEKDVSPMDFDPLNGIIPTYLEAEPTPTPAAAEGRVSTYVQSHISKTITDNLTAVAQL